MPMTLTELRAKLDANPDLQLADPHAVAQRTHQPAAGLTEHDMQAAVIAECDRRALTDPRFGLVSAIPNGQYRRGQRPEPGIRAGLPDIFLPVASRGYHSFWCELKIQTNTLSPAQRQWMERLRAEGHFVSAVWNSADAVVELIDWYLNGEASS